MTHIFRYLVALILVVTIAPQNLFAKKTEIKLNLEKGQQFEYVITATQKAATKNIDSESYSDNLNQKMEFTIHQVVLDILANGNYLIQADYKRLTFEIHSQGKNQKYDSDAQDNPPLLNSQLKNFTKIQLEFEVSPQGEVSNLKKSERFSKDTDTKARLTNIIKDFGSESILTEMFNYIPKTKVNQGDKWVVSSTLPDLNNRKYDFIYSLSEVSSNKIMLDFQADFNFETEKPIVMNGKSMMVNQTGVQKGNIVLAADNNMPLSKVTDREINMQIATTDIVTKTKSVSQMKMTYKTSMKLIK